ncbi:winged helix-turn-helix transcriptional regulator [Flavobacterium pectinovorum]|uniref:winged helix-turn-helix transcriptional regulator n=1 Tax=Flavobacterium pectinovorum TaxID=29533 RepID=UPI001FAD32E4|nr:helix-turn-helix domain-containing protein [Flavobacterium pectinovorum]MCI9843594.1 helix-turn-helix transcriptional regulator [Flavobacterium pectinovorum]
METKNNEQDPKWIAGVCKSEIGPVLDTLYVISSKWRIHIIVALISGNKRFGELKKGIPKIASKVLSQELKDMEQHGFIIKKNYSTSSLRVEYELTPYSQSIKPVINALRDFGRLHRDKIRMEIDIKEASKMKNKL